MTGFQRFCILLLLTLLVMICFPNFGSAGWTFAGTIILVWAGVILIMSVVGSLFALNRFEGINRFLSWVLVLAILASLLWFLPQEDKVSPINKLKHGEFPTMADLKHGLNKFTFRFDFLKRNADNNKNFINQKTASELEKEKEEEQQRKQTRKNAKKTLQKLEVILDDEDEE